MTKLERIRATLTPGTRLFVESNEANPATVGNMRTVVSITSGSLHYTADERPGQSQITNWDRGGRVTFDGERLAVTRPHQGNPPRTTVYRVVAL